MRARLLVILAAALAPAVALPDEKVKVRLERKLEKGARLEVKERWLVETDLFGKAKGVGTRGGAELEEVERHFTQAITREKPLAYARDYASSRRRKGHPTDPKLEFIPTSVHGRTVVFGPLGAHLQGGGHLSRDDREELDQVEKLAYALLPPDPVAVHETWKLGEAVGRAAFGRAFSPKRADAAGAGKLEALEGKGEGRIAKLSLKLAVEVPASDDAPEVGLELAGTGRFLVAAGVFEKLELEGTLHKERKGTRVAGKSDGRIRYELAAKVLPSAADAEKK